MKKEKMVVLMNEIDKDDEQNESSEYPLIKLIRMPLIISLVSNLLEKLNK